MKLVKIIFSLFLCCGILMILGCKQDVIYTNTWSKPESIDNQQESQGSPADTEPSAIIKTECLTFEWATAYWGIKSGKLNFSIDNARITKTIPSNGGFYGGWVTMHQGGTTVDYEYPNYVENNRELIDGVYLVLVDVSVHSEDAIGYTNEDRDSDGIPNGEYNDPYLFSAQSIGYFTDMSLEIKEDKHHSFYSVNANYYSDLGRYPEHPFLFRIEPGDTVTFTIGVVVGDVTEGGINDVTELHFTRSTGGIGGQHLDLALSLKEKEEYK